MLIEALLRRDGLAVDPYWIATPDAEVTDLDRFDAIWLVPGSPYQSAAGAMAAARTARQRQIPFLGTCGGFQHALLEYAPRGLRAQPRGERRDHPGRAGLPDRAA